MERLFKIQITARALETWSANSSEKATKNCSKIDEKYQNFLAAPKKQQKNREKLLKQIDCFSTFSLREVSNSQVQLYEFNTVLLKGPGKSFSLIKIIAIKIVLMFSGKALFVQIARKQPANKIMSRWSMNGH